MTLTIKAEPIIHKAIFGLAELIEASGTPDKLINQDRCGRFHDRAKLDIAGEAGISVFKSDSFAMPFTLEMMERHPQGSQAFLPMQEVNILSCWQRMTAENQANPAPLSLAQGRG